MAWTRIAENRIREAMDAGVFDDAELEQAIAQTSDHERTRALRRTLAQRQTELAIRLERGRVRTR